MWVRVWVALTFSATVWTQQASTRVQQGDASFEWGWQLTPGKDQGTVGHYYVRLPQSEQHTRYAADGTGHHGATAVNTTVHSAKFALGEKAIQLDDQKPTQVYQDILENSTQLLPNGQLIHSTGQPPVEIYLIQQQFRSEDQELVQVLPTASPGFIQYTTIPYVYNTILTTPHNNVQTQQNPTNPPKESKENEDSSKSLRHEEEQNEQESLSC